jgi:hypothetical protein
MAYNVTFTIPPRNLERADTEFLVKRNGSTLGTLRVSDLLWFPTFSISGSGRSSAESASFRVSSIDSFASFAQSAASAAEISCDFTAIEVLNSLLWFHQAYRESV